MLAHYSIKNFTSFLINAMQCISSLSLFAAYTLKIYFPFGYHLSIQHRIRTFYILQRTQGAHIGEVFNFERVRYIIVSKHLIGGTPMEEGKDGVESVAQMCNFLVYTGVGWEGRACQRVRIEKYMMVSSGRIEPAIFEILLQHSTTGPPGQGMNIKFLANI